MHGGRACDQMALVWSEMEESGNLGRNEAGEVPESQPPPADGLKPGSPLAGCTKVCVPWGVNAGEMTTHVAPFVFLSHRRDHCLWKDRLSSLVVGDLENRYSECEIEGILGKSHKFVCSIFWSRGIQYSRKTAHSPFSLWVPPAALRWTASPLSSDNRYNRVCLTGMFCAVCVKHSAQGLSPSKYSVLAIFIVLGAPHLKLKVNFLFNSRSGYLIERFSWEASRF